VKTLTTPGTASALSRRISAMRACGWGEHLNVQKTVYRHVHRVARPTGDNAFTKWVRQTGAAGAASDILVSRDCAPKRVLDRSVAGAAAQIALERVRQVAALALIQRRRP
jgi:hypothetical protein